MTIHYVIAAALLVVIDAPAQEQPPAPKAAKRAGRPGVATPGVRIPMAKLQPDAVFPYPARLSRLARRRREPMGLQCVQGDSRAV